jgi:fatty acid/phospholipid biosynthesis enzyme
VNGNVLITHGSASDVAIENAVGIAIQKFQFNINQMITDQIRNLDQPNKAA